MDRLDRQGVTDIDPTARLVDRVISGPSGATMRPRRSRGISLASGQNLTFGTLGLRLDRPWLCENALGGTIPIGQLGGRMGRFVVGADRSQITLLPECLDDWVDEDNPVHVIEAFVEALDLHTLGFEGAIAEATGGRRIIPPYS